MTGWIPTRKWLAAQAVALAGIATSWIDSGWDETESKLAVAVAVQAFVTYLLPNDPAPGGVPDAKWLRGAEGYSLVEVLLVVFLVLVILVVAFALIPGADAAVAALSSWS